MTKEDHIKNKHGRIVSAKKHATDGTDGTDGLGHVLDELWARVPAELEAVSSTNAELEAVSSTNAEPEAVSGYATGILAAPVGKSFSAPTGGSVKSKKRHRRRARHTQHKKRKTNRKKKSRKSRR